MIRNYLLITLRSLLKNKIFVIINILGLGVAVACCIVAYLNYQYDATWNAPHKNAATLYRVQFTSEFQDRTYHNGTAPMPLANNIRSNFKDVDKVIKFQESRENFRIGDEMFNTHIGFADSAFFEVFNYELKYGQWKDFHDKSRIFISDELARKYFHKEDAVGELLAEVVNGVTHEFVVGGVFKKQVTNTSFDEQAFTLYDNYWDLFQVRPDRTEDDWSRFNITFVQIKDPSRIASIEERLQAYVAPQNRAKEDFKVKRYYLESFEGIAQRSRDMRLQNEWLNNGVPREAIWLPNLMAILLLLLACFNFTNTSIAASSQRIKEIGVRKVMGGIRKQLVLQFLGENLLLCFLGLLTGLLIAEWLVPTYDELWAFIDLKLSYTENAGFLLFLVVLLLGTGLIAGSYPAFYITSFEPISILRGTLKFGGTSWFTRILLWSQFTISVLSITFAVAFFENAKYQRNYDLGFSTSGIVSAWVTNEAGYNTFRDAIADNKDITVIAGSKHHVANGWDNGAVKYEALEKHVDIMEVGENYLQAANMKIVSGRDFNKDSKTDLTESIIVTEEFVKQFGWKDTPIGKRIVYHDTVQLYVIGVIKDVYARALWRPVEPMMLRLTPPSNYSLAIVSMPALKMKSVNEYMEKKWKTVFPNTLYNGQPIDWKMAESIEISSNVVKMFGFLGFVAILLSVSGLYTLVSLNILKKMKSIGVRKVLGASHLNIARVINLEFVVVLGIAGISGGVAGYFLVEMIMGGVWTYYKSLDAISFVISISIMFAIAALAVSFKTVSTASMNPVKTLRDE